MLEVKPRCLLAGQSTLVLHGLSCLLETDFEVRVSSADDHTAVAAALVFDPKVAVVDVEIGEIELKTARLLTQVRASLPVLCLVREDVQPFTDLQWIKKTNCSRAEFLDAVRAACALTTSPAKCQRNQPESDGRTPGAAVVMSQRERQVVSLLARGLTMKEAARTLHITARTIAFHKYRLMGKNDLRTNADLIAFATKHGI